MTKEELMNGIESVKEEMRQMVDNAEVEKRSLTDEEKAQFEEKQRQLDTFKTELETKENEIKNQKINDRSMKKNYLNALSQHISDVANQRDCSEYTNQTGNTIELRDDAYTTVTDGDVTAIQDLEYTRIIEPLENSVVFQKLGLTYINTGALVKMPSVSNVSASINGENTKVETEKIEFTNKPITPVRLAVAVGLSNTAIKTVESNINLVAYALRAMREAEARLINHMILSPVAVSNDGVTVKGPFVDILAGDASVSGVCSWPNILDLETKVKNANGQITERAAFVTTPAVAAKLRSMPIALKGDKAAHLGFIMQDGKIDGIPVYETNECRALDASNNVQYEYLGFCSDWSTVIFQEVGASSLIIDPYTKAASNETNLVMNSDCGFNWERNSNFTAMKIDASSWIQ